MHYKNQDPNTPLILLIPAKNAIEKSVKPNDENHNQPFKGMIVPLPPAVKHISQRYSFDNNGGNYQGL
ncbi:MAG TPA: hypothetical protein VEX63_00305 [Flavisolibacter sp.]|jgi:hypothetical protein|nr:hypothetical protein [Flavisolibacter sp.]HZH99551.1 hypothetical protein [Flavisolibacter sp.]